MTRTMERLLAADECFHRCVLAHDVADARVHAAAARTSLDARPDTSLARLTQGAVERIAARLA